MKTSPQGGSLDEFVKTIKELPFVRSVKIAADEQGGSLHHDAILTIVDPEKHRFEFSAEVKRSYLDRAAANAAIARVRLVSGEQDRPLLLLAKYVPSPTAERFMNAGVNFIDLVGNMHIALGNRYSRTILGKPEEKPSREHLGMTAAQLQVLILFATYPEAGAWPVRDIAAKAGVGKSMAADARRQMIARGVLERGPSGYSFPRSRQSDELILTGYSQILRPKLLVGRYQSAFQDADRFVNQLSSVSKKSPQRFALTGGPAANLLHPYYRGPQTPLFAMDSGADTRRLLRLLPDREGPITILRAFGELVFWRVIDSLAVAPPWLIYAEMMQSSDPRAHEAAEEFRQEFLAP